MTQIEELLNISKLIDISCYSSLDKLLKVTAMVKGFVSKLKELCKGLERENLTDIRGAELEWIKVTQTEMRQMPNYNKLVK